MRLAACLFALLLTACAARQNSATPQIASAPAAATPTAAKPAALDPLAKPAAIAIAKAIAANDADPAATASPAQSGAIDASCQVDADCAVKDVGSCCGYSPRCVNTNSETFPEQVKARCDKQGRVGICGFPAISGCRCVKGSCADSNAAASGQ